MFQLILEKLMSYIPLKTQNLFINIKSKCEWKLALTFFKPDCYHGFFEAIGNEFDDLKEKILNADVLDACRSCTESSCRIKTHLSWICKTSPPTDCIGMLHC
jgi:hypothetical protein